VLQEMCRILADQGKMRIRNPATKIRKRRVNSSVRSASDDTPDQRASLRSFAGSGRNRKYCIAILVPRFSGEGLIRSPGWMNLYCAPWFRSTSAISQRALLSFISSSMPLIALLLGIRLPSGRRRERSR
jgi:hypothetical protein